MTFPTSPTNGQTTQKFGKKFAFNSTSGAWRPVSSPVVATVREPVATPAVVSSASGLPMTGNTVGKTAYVSETNRLYIWNGSGWFEMALINTNPTITTGGDATYALNSDGTPTVITLVANDPEGVPLTWSYAVTSGSLEDVTISNTGAEFTITPGTIETSFNLTFTASDGINIDTSASSFTLVFEPDWTASTLLQTLNNPNAYGTSSEDIFGYALAMSGNYAIVGAISEDAGGGVQSGAAYIFNITTGALVHTLLNPNAYGTPAYDQFGYAVAISGNYAIVGTADEDDGGTGPGQTGGTGTSSGKAYIFDVTTGALIHTLNNRNAYYQSAGDLFGKAVAIDGNYAIVGASNERDDGGTGSGKAYIYNVTTGAAVRILNNPNAYGTSVDDRFGYAVAISGNYAIVGAYQEDDGGTGSGQTGGGGLESGKAYIFNVSTGALVHTLTNPNAFGTSAGDWFGFVVSMSGNYAIVGAPYEGGGTTIGKAYIFNVTTGALIHTLNSPNNIDSDRFGWTAAISGNYAIVGVGTAFNVQQAHIFDVTTGVLLKSFDNPNAYGTVSGDNFARSVAISDNYAIVSAYGEGDAGGSGSGKAYIFQAG